MPGSAVEDELPEACTSPKPDTVSIPATIVSSRRPRNPDHHPLHAVRGQYLAIAGTGHGSTANHVPPAPGPPVPGAVGAPTAATSRTVLTLCRAHWGTYVVRHG